MIKFQPFMLCLLLSSATTALAQEQRPFKPNIGLEANINIYTPWYKQREQTEMMLRYSFGPGNLGPIHHQSALRLSGREGGYRYAEGDLYSDTDRFYVDNRWGYSTHWQVALGYEQQLFFFNNRLRASIGTDLMVKRQAAVFFTQVLNAPRTGKFFFLRSETTYYTLYSYGLRPNFGLSVFPVRWLSVGAEWSWALLTNVQYITEKQAGLPERQNLYRVPDGQFTSLRFLYVGIHF